MIFDKIRQWALDRGIYNKGDIKTQCLKLHEESGELSRAILKNDIAEFKDAIGDCVVVLTNLAELGSRHFGQQMTIESCVKEAFDVIENRKGKMKNGTFEKAE